MGFLQGYGFDRGTGDKGLSSAVWKDFGLDALWANPRLGMFCIDRFQCGFLTGESSGTGQFITGSGVYQQSVKTSNDGLASILNTEEGGGLNLTSETNVAGEGITFTALGPFVTPEANSIIAYEGLMQLGQLGTITQFLFGLIDAGETLPIDGGVTPILHANATDVVAFYNLIAGNASPQGTLQTINAETGEADLESTALQVDGSDYTIVASTDFKLGCRITGLEKMEYFIDGALVHTVVAADQTTGTVPTLPMCLCNVTQADDGSTIATSLTRWWAIAQKDY